MSHKAPGTDELECKRTILVYRDKLCIIKITGQVIYGNVSV